MELAIFEALTSANVSPDKARAAAASIEREIDRRYSLLASQLATKGDVLEVKVDIQKQMATSQFELIKWAVGSVFAGCACMTAILKLM